jgi:hypothetical protein
MTVMHPRKRIDIFVEMAVLPKVEEALTVVPCIKGRGWSGEWSSDEIADAERMVMLTTITRAEALDVVLESLRPVMQRWRIVVSVADVQVLRSEKF